MHGCDHVWNASCIGLLVKAFPSGRGLQGSYCSSGANLHPVHFVIFILSGINWGTCYQGLHTLVLLGAVYFPVLTSVAIAKR